MSFNATDLSHLHQIFFSSLWDSGVMIRAGDRDRPACLGFHVCSSIIGIPNRQTIFTRAHNYCSQGSYTYFNTICLDFPRPKKNTKFLGFQNSNNVLPTSKDVPGVIFEHTTVLQHCKQCLITQVLLAATELTIPVQVNIALPPRHVPQTGNLSNLLEYAVKIPFNINIFFVYCADPYST